MSKKFPNAFLYKNIEYSRDLDESNTNFQNVSCIHDFNSIPDDTSLYDVIILKKFTESKIIFNASQAKSH